MREMSQHDFVFKLCVRINWVGIYENSLHDENSRQINFLYYLEECFMQRCSQGVID